MHVDLASIPLHKSRRDIRKNEVQQTNRQENPEVTNFHLFPHTHTQTNHGAAHRDNTYVLEACFGTVSTVQQLQYGSYVLYYSDRQVGGTPFLQCRRQD